MSVELGIETHRVRMQHISKRFGDVQALDDVDFCLASGEVHALLGENGAGKTSLMNVLSGLYLADSGGISVNGKEVSITSPRGALENGIGMVHQHFELIPQFRATENIIIGREGGNFTIDFDMHAGRIRDLMGRFGLTIDVDAKVKDLAIGLQQKVEILKALYRDASVLILDEPTTMLTPQEVDGLFAVIRTLVEKGLSVVFISHKIKEVLAVSDRITIMREGRVVATVSAHEATEQSLVEVMIGERADGSGPGTEGNAGRASRPEGEILRTERMGVKDDRGNWISRNVAITGRRGEVVGLVGVSGNGQREVAEAIYGLQAIAEGNVRIASRDVSRSSIKERLNLGVALIPEDRVRQGILPNQSVAETLILGPHHFLFAKSLIIPKEKVRSLARDLIARFRIAVPDDRTRTSLLSGGNIQKVITARAFLLTDLVEPTMMIAFNPTRGLDYLSTKFVRSRLIELRDRRACVLLVSEDLDESLAMCDRIYVMYRGKVVGEFARGAFDPYRIGALMTGLESTQ